MTDAKGFVARLEDIDNITGRGTVTLDGPRVGIGRSQKNDIVIREITISGMHAAVERGPEGHRIVDLGSTNKTRLNGRELTPNTPTVLADGDEIRIDTFRFVYRAESPAPQAERRPIGTSGDAGSEALDASGDETVFLDNGSVTGDEGVPTRDRQADVSASGDGDETVFFDSQTAMTEERASPPEEALPEAATEDGDETVFFDSQMAMTEERTFPPEEALPEAAAEDGDETVFFDSADAWEADGEDRGGPAPGQEAAPETQNIGSYAVLSLLGKGGFGSVWKARSPAGRTVAVKVLNPDILDNDKAVRKFFHEAIILSRLEHPNICAFIDFFPHEGNYAIVMDFVQGVDLKDLLDRQKGPLPLETATAVASQTLDAFHYALEKKVLHRDIKPENITLEASGSVKVMDFGIARLSSSESQQTSLFMISPAYTAPERFDANKADLVDHRSDIYSLGLVFYEIFTGTHPFPATNPVAMIQAHLQKVPDPPGDIVEMPRKISDGILRALEKNPEDRPEDFAAFKMEMLGEPPLRTSQSLGVIEFAGDQCRSSAALLKTLAGILKKHQKNAARISIGQGGAKVHLIVETVGGTTIRIQRDIGSS